MPRTPKTKIIATLGPASSSETVLRKMMLSGLDVVRLNASHSSGDFFKLCTETVKRLNAKYKRHLKILFDLEGHRIRVGRFKGFRSIELRKGMSLRLVQKESSDEKKEVPFDYEGSLKGVKADSNVYIDDGNIVLAIKQVGHDSIKTKVLTAGILYPRKGINIPGSELDFPGLSEKDKQGIILAGKLRVDFIAQSFVREAADIKTLKSFMKQNNIDMPVIAKVENRKALINLVSIIKSSDMIMVARGDLGVCMPLNLVPFVQKQMIKRCNKLGKPVITATQMLESMKENRLPTRAEVTDVANSVLDGTDYVMLSAETAVGRYPAETVNIMNQIIKSAEDYSKQRNMGFFA